MQSSRPGGRITKGRWLEPNQAGRFRFTRNADGPSFTGLNGPGDAESTSDWCQDRPAPD